MAPAVEFRHRAQDRCCSPQNVSDVARIVLTTAYAHPHRPAVPLAARRLRVAMVTDALHRSLLTSRRPRPGRRPAPRARTGAAPRGPSPRPAPRAALGAGMAVPSDLCGAGTGWTLQRRPSMTRRVSSGDVDALHVASRTVVELDGRTFHGPDRFQSDRTRDQRLVAAGLRRASVHLGRRRATPDWMIGERIRRTVARRHASSPMIDRPTRPGAARTAGLAAGAPDPPRAPAARPGAPTRPLTPTHPRRRPARQPATPHTTRPSPAGLA